MVFAMLTMIGSAVVLAFRWLRGDFAKPRGPVRPWIDVPTPRKTWPPDSGSGNVSR